MPTEDSFLDRVWTRIERRYDGDGMRCSCTTATEPKPVSEGCEPAGDDIPTLKQGRVTVVGGERPAADDSPSTGEATKAARQGDFETEANRPGSVDE